MSNQKHGSLVKELREHWDAKPNGCCFCGCGGSTGHYFASGHDSHFAANLLETLRGNQQVAQAIQDFVGRCRE